MPCPGGLAVAADAALPGFVAGPGRPPRGWRAPGRPNYTWPRGDASGRAEAHRRRRRSARRAPPASQGTPASSSASTASVPPPPQRATSAPSRTSIVGAGVGGVAGSSTRVRSTRAGTPADRACARPDTAARRRARDCGSSPHRASSRWCRPPAGVRRSTARGKILRHARRGAGDQRGQHAVERDLRGDGDLVEDLARRVVGQDRHGRLRDDVAGVGLVGHVVQRRARFALAMEHRPVHRRAAAVSGQQRAVHVERAAPRRRQQRRVEHGAGSRTRTGSPARAQRRARRRRRRSDRAARSSAMPYSRAVSATEANQMRLGEDRPRA